MTTIAFAGLGSMGLPMARNLLQRGFTVRGFDVNARALEALTGHGGQPFTTAAAAAQGAPVLLLMVVNAAQAEAVLFEGGALEALAPGAVVCLMATPSPSWLAAARTPLPAPNRSSRQWARR